MKVLVTGAAGFLGSWITDKLVEAGHEVVALDNCVSGDWNNIKTSLVEPTTVRLTHCSVDEWSNYLGRGFEGCSAVYHCAALPYEGLSVYSPAMVVRNIVSGTVNVATAAIRAGVKRFINCSSMARYGKGSPPFQEYHATHPCDPYGMAKVQAEEQLDLLGTLHNMTVLHAVPHNIYGPRQRYDDPYRNVAAIMVNRMLRGLQPIIYGDGSQVRCFSYIDDVLPTMLQLLDCEADHGEVFNVGPDDGWVSIRELANIIANLLHWTTLEPIYLPPRRCEVARAYCSSAKIRDRFDYETKTTLAEGLRQLIEDVKRRGPKEFDYFLRLELPEYAPAAWKEKLI